MTPVLAYFMKINIGIALFYAFYRLFFYRDTFFHWRRYTLLAFFIISLLYPLMNIQEWVKEQEPMREIVAIYANNILPEVGIIPQEDSMWTQLIKDGGLIIYWIGIGLLLIRFLVQLISISILAIRCKKTEVDGIYVRILNKPSSPFSFFQWIFISPELHSEKEAKDILTHEETHARQWHSIDIIISELISILCWINPFVWLLKREVRNNLEYMADNRVILSGHDTKSYQYHLLGLANHKAATNLYNSFNVLPIKNRITMMNRKRTKSIGRTKYVLFIPLAALLLLFSNIEAVARATGAIANNVMNAMEGFPPEKTAPIITPDAKQSEINIYSGRVIDADGKAITASILLQRTREVITCNSEGDFTIKAQPLDILIISNTGFISKKIMLSKNENQDLTIILYPQKKNGKEKDTISIIPQKMPEYPGGVQALLKYVLNNVKYPEISARKGIQGKVYVRFIITKTGDVVQATIMRSLDPYCDAEALRVINGMSKWTPGKQIKEGKEEAVDVYYVMPITFKLTNEKTNVVNKNISNQKSTNKKNTSESTYTVVDEMPQFPGGEAALLEHIFKNLKYPIQSQKNGVQGKVYVRITISENGDVEKAQIMRSLDTYCDKEALRVISSLPKWIPGKQNGVNVPVYYVIPIIFKLS